MALTPEQEQALAAIADRELASEPLRVALAEAEATLEAISADWRAELDAAAVAVNDKWMDTVNAAREAVQNAQTALDEVG